MMVFTCGFNELYHCATFIICSVIFIAGFWGNCFTIFLLIAKKKFRTKATFTCINLLAFSDLMALTLTYYADMLTSTEDDLNSLSAFECTVAMTLGFTPFLISCYALVLLAVVRYHVIAYPLSVSLLESRKVIILLYLAGAVAIASSLAVVAVISLQSMNCHDTFNNNGYLAFIHPPIIIVTIAILLVLHAMKIRRLRLSLSARTHNLKTSIRRINLVIYIIMCLFLICQLPFIIHDISTSITCHRIYVADWPFYGHFAQHRNSILSSEPCCQPVCLLHFILRLPIPNKKKWTNVSTNQPARHRRYWFYVTKSITSGSLAIHILLVKKLEYLKQNREGTEGCSKWIVR